MKSDLEKRLEYVRSQRKVLQRTEDELKKQLEAEKSKFDFKTKMPVGSVWLGNLAVNYWEGKIIKFVRQFLEEMPATIYHAHQIVKAAQEWHNKNTIGCYESILVPLKEAIEAAEEAGVLQNLQ